MNWIVSLHSFDRDHTPLWRIWREDGKPMDTMTLCAALRSVMDAEDQK